jgi:glycosyltransferase involved in cell wall biosynthesis
MDTSTSPENGLTNSAPLVIVPPPSSPQAKSSQAEGAPIAAPQVGPLARLLPADHVGRAVHASMAAPEIALCVTTYQKPWHLRRTLASIAGQRGVDGRFELVVTDDGSIDETEELVERFSRTAPFSVKFTTHAHSAFHPGRSRNEGARAATAPYLLYIDGDCVLPPDHVAVHLHGRRQSKFVLGESYRIEQEMSQSLTEEGATRGDFLRWNVPDEQRRLARLHRSHLYNSLIRHRAKPRLISNNFGIWRSDLGRVNGFDENYRGWGQEDDDLGRRLRRAGVRPRSVLGRTRLYHLWHPRDPSVTNDWHDGPNVRYFFRRGWLSRCRNGLVKRPLSDLAIAIVGQAAQPGRVAELWRQLQQSVPGFPSRESMRPAGRRPEVEMLFLPGDGRFSGRAECNLLVALDDSPIRPELLDPRTTHRIVGDRPFPDIPGHYQFRLADFARALDSIT